MHSESKQRMPKCICLQLFPAFCFETMFNEHVFRFVVGKVLGKEKDNTASCPQNVVRETDVRMAVSQKDGRQ